MTAMVNERVAVCIMAVDNLPLAATPTNESAPGADDVGLDYGFMTVNATQSIAPERWTMEIISEHTVGTGKKFLLSLIPRTGLATHKYTFSDVELYSAVDSNNVKRSVTVSLPQMGGLVQYSNNTKIAESAAESEDEDGLDFGKGTILIRSNIEATVTITNTAWQYVDGPESATTQQIVFSSSDFDTNSEGQVFWSWKPLVASDTAADNRTNSTLLSSWTIALSAIHTESAAYTVPTSTGLGTHSSVIPSIGAFYYLLPAAAVYPVLASPFATLVPSTGGGSHDYGSSVAINGTVVRKTETHGPTAYLCSLQGVPPLRTCGSIVTHSNNYRATAAAATTLPPVEVYGQHSLTGTTSCPLHTAPVLRPPAVFTAPGTNVPHEVVIGIGCGMLVVTGLLFVYLWRRSTAYNNSAAPPPKV